MQTTWIKNRVLYKEEQSLQETQTERKERTGEGENAIAIF